MIELGLKMFAVSWVAGLAWMAAADNLSLALARRRVSFTSIVGVAAIAVGATGLIIAIVGL